MTQSVFLDRYPEPTPSAWELKGPNRDAEDASGSARRFRPEAWVLGSENATALDNTDLLGGKASNLLRLSQAGLPVPAWFVVTAPACAWTLASVHDAIAATLDNIDYGDSEAVHRASEGIAAIIGRAPLPPGLEESLARRLARAEAERFAVRSSAVAEDSATDSFAGQLDTFLHVPRDEVVPRVRACWASAFSARGLAYMHERGIEPRAATVAVVIQAMVDSAAAGVLFTANPMGDIDEMVVVAAYGLGEGVVADRVESDTYTYSRASAAWRVAVGNKCQKIVLNSAAGQGTALQDVPAELRQQPVLDAAAREELRALAERVAGLYDHPQDIEWATDSSGRFWLTQSRPITSLPRGPVTVFDNSNVVESYPGISSPLTFSHVSKSYAEVFRRAALRLGASHVQTRATRDAFEHMMGYVQGRIYYNLTNWYRIFGLIPSMQRFLPVWEEMLGVRAGARPDAGHGRGEGPVARLGSLVRRCRSDARWVWHFASLDVQMARLQRHTTRLIGRLRQSRLEALHSHDLCALYSDVGAEIMHGWELTLINDAFAFGCSHAVRALLDRVGLGVEVFGGLMAGSEDLESVEPVRSLVGLGELLRAHAPLRDAVDELLRKDDLTLADLAPLEHVDGGPAFLTKVQHHLDRYGDRCIEELKLESKCFREDPAALLQRAQAFAEAGLTVAEMQSKETDIRTRAHGALAEQTRGRPVMRLLIRAALIMARRSTRYRESSRLDRARAFRAVASIFRQLGRVLAAEGALEKADDVFMLTVDELQGWVAGGSIDPDVKATVERRRAMLEGFARRRPAERVRSQGTVGSNPVAQRDEATAGDDDVEGDATLRGVGCSSSIATGEALVVRDPRDVQDAKGKVLVAETTDPGWVFLMVSAAALVVEKGSLLSHTAIIGRELGVPTVVGVQGATQRIRSGQRLRVDGQTGEICVLDHEAFQSGAPTAKEDQSCVP